MTSLKTAAKRTLSRLTFDLRLTRLSWSIHMLIWLKAGILQLLINVDVKAGFQMLPASENQPDINVSSAS